VVKSRTRTPESGWVMGDPLCALLPAYRARGARSGQDGLNAHQSSPSREAGLPTDPPYAAGEIN
jgi:hypothetical protein